MHQNNIIILGGGFSGLRAAKKIDRGIKKLRLQDQYRVVLVDRWKNHVFTPLLYRLAITKSVNAIPLVAYDIVSLLSGTSVAFMEKEVTKIDLEREEIYFSDSEKISAAILLLALGSEVNYFNISHLEKTALSLKSSQDALRIREKVFGLLESGMREVRIVVGGGGPTGIELSIGLKQLNDRYPDRRISVTLLEATSTLLPGFDPRLPPLALHDLETAGVLVRTSEPVERVIANEIHSSHGTVFPFDVFIWTGGVKPPGLLNNFSLKREPRGKIEVGEGMQCIPGTSDLHLTPALYAIGDNVCFYHPRTQKPVPAVARAALSEADVAAQNILEDISFREGLIKTKHHISFSPEEYPYIIPTGRHRAIAKIGPFIFVGRIAWFLETLVHLRYLISIMPLPRAARTWFATFRAFY